MAKISNLIQGSEEWLEFRRNHIGASDIAAIMGVSPFKTKAQLWVEKFRRVDQIQNAAMRHGIETETEARICFSSMQKKIYSPDVFEHDRIRWASCSLDGVDDVSRSFVEIKCPVRTLPKKIPLHYYYQMQWSLFVTGFDRGFFFSYLHADNFYIEEILPDEQTIQLLLEGASEFWHSRELDVCPYVDETAYQWMDESSEAAQIEYLEAQERLKIAQAAEKSAKQKILEFTDGLSCVGKHLTVKSYEVTGSVDYEKLLSDLKVDQALIEKYRKPSMVYTKISKNK